jgi:hypothetical protein
MVRELADGLIRSLRTIRDEFTLAPNTGPTPDPAAASTIDADSAGLIDLLFDRGLLPSYAFPTDLCSFVIQEWDKNDSRWRINVAERPQLAKTQALSEYAPGRLLVVNKQTYRVGGVFVEGPPTSSPAASLFARPLDRYIGCSRCSFLTIESGTAPARTTEGSPCPVCGTPLFVREYLDPPAFTPENARSLREGDREQDVTFASTAQLPEIAGRDDFEWRDGPGTHLRHAYGQDVLLVVANKGKDAAGFSICESCGASWIDGEEPDGPHSRPFLLPNHIREKEGASSRCSGAIRRGLFLVHDFRTDLLMLRGALQRPMDFSPEQPWLYDALTTLAEALALGASLHLDIDPGEVSAGFRLLPPLAHGDDGVAELYLFDTSSGGAGYAADAGAELELVLDATEQLLRVCPADCQRSCTKCLRHYGNRFFHSRLDRRLAADLLAYFRRGACPTFAPREEQAQTLRPLARFLTLEGWSTESNDRIPLRAVSNGGRILTVGTYPALVNAEFAREHHDLPSTSGVMRVLLPDYLVEHDLPSAYQVAIGKGPMRSPRRNAGPSLPGARSVELPVKDLRRSAMPATLGTVRLRVDQELPGTAFAVRVPGEGLDSVGFSPGGWLVLRPFDSADVGSDAWLVVTRKRAKFAPTASDWTIARVKALPGDENGGRFQLSYGSATGRDYRPERIGSSDVTLTATIVCHAAEAS